MGRPNGRSFLLNLLSLWEIVSKQRCRRRSVSVSPFIVFRFPQRASYGIYAAFRALYGYMDNNCFVLVAKEKLDFWFFKMDRKT